MKKSLVLLTVLAGLSVAAASTVTLARPVNAAADVLTYLVLTKVGVYHGEEVAGDIEDMYLENAIEYYAAPGSPLPGADKVTTIDDSEGVFSSWIAYEGKGAPTRYTTVPNKQFTVLYAYFEKDSAEPKTLSSLTYEGEFTKTTYNLDDGETFSSEGVTIYANFSDDSKVDVTSEVTWTPIKVGSTSVTASYTYKGGTKTVTIDGLTVTGTITTPSIYLNANKSYWDKDNAWFAAYCWKGSVSTWFKLEKDTEHNDYYTALIDTEVYDHVIFCRMDPAKTELAWASKWNQTADLTFDGNCYTITGWGTSTSTGSWSTI